MRSLASLISTPHCFHLSHRALVFQLVSQTTSGGLELCDECDLARETRISKHWSTLRLLVSEQGGEMHLNHLQFGAHGEVLVWEYSRTSTEADAGMTAARQRKSKTDSYASMVRVVTSRSPHDALT